MAAAANQTYWGAGVGDVHCHCFKAPVLRLEGCSNWFPIIWVDNGAIIAFLATATFAITTVLAATAFAVTTTLAITTALAITAIFAITTTAGLPGWARLAQWALLGGLVGA